MISFQLIASINHENMKLSLQTILIEIITFLNQTNHLQITQIHKILFHHQDFPTFSLSPSHGAITYVEMAVNNRHRDQHNKRQVD